MLSSGTKEGEAGAVGCRGHQLLLSQQLLLSWVASLVTGRPLLATPGLVMTRRSPRPPPPRLLFSGSDPTCQGCSWTRLALRSVPGSPGGSLLWDRVPLSQSQSLGAEKQPPTPPSHTSDTPPTPQHTSLPSPWPLVSRARMNDKETNAERFLTPRGQTPPACVGREEAYAFISDMAGGSN